MANYLASIFGTEQDKVNCSFYYKIGACRHGDRCSRKHVKPSYSQTILLPNLYQNPAYDPKNKMNPQQMQHHFDAFYEDIWCELCQYGLVEELGLRPHIILTGYIPDEALADLYRDHDGDPARAWLHRVAERLVDHDEGIALWRQHHVLMVAREIGTRRGTGGSPGVPYLKTTLDRRFFPDLWDVRVAL